jgi:hypothetical protein
METDEMTPADLARELDVSARRVRLVLRDRYGLLSARGETRWLLNEEEQDVVRRAVRRP